MAFEEREHLVVLDLWYVRQGSQKSEHLTPIGQPTACDLPDDERMAEHLSIAEEPSQPGVGKAGDQLVRLKFRPNPHYPPPSRVEQVLTGMEGSLLIDKGALRLAKIEARLFRDVTFGWGILGHLDRGGTFTVWQADVGDGSWELTHLQLSMTGKVMLVKNISFKLDEVLSDFRRVPSDLTFAKGVELLKTEVARMQNTGPDNASASRKPQ